MPIGLPEIAIDFKTKGLTAIQRSSRGIVAIILKDDTDAGEKYVFNSIDEVNFTEWSETSFDYINLVFYGAPSKVIAIRLPAAAANYNDALAALKSERWNYLTIPGIAPGDTAAISAWIKGQRDDHKKTFKAVLPNTAADHEGIINFTTDNVKVGEKTYTTSAYCARIAGVLAGLSLSRSATYFAFPEIESADENADPDAAINDGELILIYDGAKYKIGRGVNSLVTFTASKGEDFRKIKIVEARDLYYDDVKTTFEEYYVGKVINDYDNKQLFIAAVNAYHKLLEGDVLDTAFDNHAQVSFEGQKIYLQGKGMDTSSMSEIEILSANTGSQVFVDSVIKFVDAMEDLKMTVYM